MTAFDLQKGVKALFGLEDTFLGNLQQAPSRVHNALRNVGKFPLIITTNMDELLERFLWKTGNGGEKLRLDQVGIQETSKVSSVSHCSENIKSANSRRSDKLFVVDLSSI